MSQFVKKILPKVDADAYADAKFIIQAHNASAKKWWQALADIKRNEWYLVEFPTFQEWCEKHCTWTPATIRKALQEGRESEAEELIKQTTGEPIIKRAKVSRSLNQGVSSSRGDTTQVENKGLLSSNGATSRKSDKVYDQEQHEVPDHLIESYLAYKEFEALHDGLKSVKERLSGLRKTGRIWKKIDSVAEAHIQQAMSDIEDAKPHTVCTECQGWFEDTKQGCCPSCQSTGIMSERQFNQAIEATKSIHKNEANRVPRLSNPLS